MHKILLRILISGLIVAYFSFKADWQIIFEAFTKINLIWYVTATCIGITGPIIMACKYHLLVKNTKLKLSLPRLIIINFISRFYALLLPTALGPEAVRWYKVTKSKQGRSFFLAATIFERTLFIVILLLAGTIPLFFYTQNHNILLFRQTIFPTIIACYIILTFLLIFFLVPKLQEPFKQLIKKYAKLSTDSIFYKFLNNFKIHHLSGKLTLLLIGLSLLWQLVLIFRIYFLFLSMSLSVTIVDVTWMGSLVLLLQVIPVSFAGIGVREGAYAYLFTLFDLPPEKGIIIGILFFTQMLILSGIGGILEIFEK